MAIQLECGSLQRPDNWWITAPSKYWIQELCLSSSQPPFNRDDLDVPSRRLVLSFPLEAMPFGATLTQAVSLSIHFLSLYLTEKVNVELRRSSDKRMTIAIIST